MDLLSYFIDFVKAVVWPTTIFLVLNKFGNEIKALIEHIKITLSFGDKKVEITHERAEELKLQQESTPQDSQVKELKEENKKHSDIEKRLLELQENITRDKNALFLGYHFEKTYRLIFGSQLSILNLAYGHGKISDALVAAIYRRTVWASSYPYQDYINFLVNSGLLTQLNPSDGTYSLQPVGKAFIEYLNNNYIPLNKIPY